MRAGNVFSMARSTSSINGELGIPLPARTNVPSSFLGDRPPLRARWDRQWQRPSCDFAGNADRGTGATGDAAAESEAISEATIQIVLDHVGKLPKSAPAI